MKSIVVSGRTLGQRHKSNNNEQKPHSMEFNLFISHSILESWWKHNEIWVGNKWCYMIYAAMLGHTLLSLLEYGICGLWTGHSEMTCTSARSWTKNQLEIKLIKAMTYLYRFYWMGNRMRCHSMLDAMSIHQCRRLNNNILSLNFLQK